MIKIEQVEDKVKASYVLEEDEKGNIIRHFEAVGDTEKQALSFLINSVSKSIVENKHDILQSLRDVLNPPAAPIEIPEEIVTVDNGENDLENETDNVVEEETPIVEEEKPVVTLNPPEIIQSTDKKGRKTKNTQ